MSLSWTDRFERNIAFDADCVPNADGWTNIPHRQAFIIDKIEMCVGAEMRFGYGNVRVEGNWRARRRYARRRS
jgi:hypothetical protein